MRSVLPFVALLTFTSCGFFKSADTGKDPKSERQIASEGARQLANMDSSSLSELLDEKLNALHTYYLIGHKNLQRFDADLDEIPPEKLYESEAYLNLIAVRTQAEEIEHDIKEAYVALGSQKDRGVQRLALRLKIEKMARKSPYGALSMENLMHQLDVKSAPVSFNKSKMKGMGLEAELKQLDSKELAVFEKNVEHLSHLIDIELENEGKKFYPSTDKPGNIIGSEFPEKVWSLTFDDGPGKETSKVILKALQERNLKATFFQLTKNVKAFPEMAKEIREAGMEIASHSYTHPEIPKLGPAAMEREITGAVEDLKKAHGDIEIKFFRLPYGAGTKGQAIREKIKANKLIHVFWNIDTLDWMPQEPEKIVARTKALMKATKKDSGVILFHDIHKRTTIASVKIMDHLKKDGRRVCTLDEIVTQMNEGAETVCPSK